MRSLIQAVIGAAGIAPIAAHADYLYTVHFDEASVTLGPDTLIYAADEFSFIAPSLLGGDMEAPDFFPVLDLAVPEPSLNGMTIDRVQMFAFSSGQYVFNAAAHPQTFNFADVRGLLWVFQTPDGSTSYGPGTYGLSCLKNGLPSNECFSRALQGLPSLSGTGYMTVALVPVPAAVWLFGSALGLLSQLRRKVAI